MDLRTTNRGGLGSSWRLGAAALAAAVCGAAASAQDAPRKGAADEPVLKGPAVKERAVPGVVNTFGDAQAARRMAERIPPEVLRGALGVLTAEDAPAEIRATPEQEAEFAAIGEELRSAVKKYMAEHREELIELRRDANLSGRAAAEIDRAIGRRAGGAERGRGQGETPPERSDTREGEAMSGEGEKMDEAGESKQEAARQRLRELMAGAPRIEDYMTRAWEKLSPAQREAVDGKLDEFREREAKKREEMYVRQRMSERKPEGVAAGNDEAMAARPRAGEPAPAQRPGAKERPNVAGAQRRERLVRLFESLSAEQQEMLLERLENAVRDGGFGAGRGRGQRPGGATEKPAPGMDEVEVPRPEDVEKDAGQSPPPPPPPPPASAPARARPAKRPNPA